MKRLIATASIIALSLSLAGCGKNSEAIKETAKNSAIRLACSVFESDERVDLKKLSTRFDALAKISSDYQSIAQSAVEFVEASNIGDGERIEKSKEKLTEFCSAVK